MKSMHWTHQGATDGNVFRVHPLQLLGAIFLCIGLFFVLLGGAFMLASNDMLPQVFTAAAWSGDTPDELALPIVGVVFSCIGLIFTLTGGTMLLLRRRQRLLREELERYGIRVTGTVTDVRIDRSYQVNHRSPLRVYITAVHPTTGETVTVRSDAVWETTLAPGAAAEVLFDPADEKKHIVIVDQ